MNYSYKPVLQEQVIKERKEKEKQEALHKKYGIAGNRIIQIKKENLFTAITKVLGKLLKKIVTILLVILAFSGAVACLHPDSREALVYVYTQAVYQAEELCPLIKEVIEKWEYTTK